MKTFPGVLAAALPWLAAVSLAFAQTEPLPLVPFGQSATVPFIATGGSSTATAADRATQFGTSFDLRADLGGVGSGSSSTAADTAAMIAFAAQRNASSLSVVRLTVPTGTFSLTPQSFGFGGSIEIDGSDELGSVIQLTASTDLSNILGVLDVTAGSSLVLRNLTIDLNGDGAATAKAFILNTGSGVAPVLDHVRIINAGVVGALPAQLELVNAVQMPECSISDSYFAFLSMQNTANEALNFGNNTYPGLNCIVRGNKAVNTQLIESVGIDNLIVSDNINTGVGYGACFANAPSSPTTTFFHILYKGNICRDTGTVPDVNGSYPSGIQNWQNGVVAIGNHIANTCAQGIAFGGVTKILNNEIEDPGSCLSTPTRGAGITAISSGAGGSTVSGNVVSNVNTTNGTYGYADVSGVTVPVKFGVNDFGSMPSGPFDITGAATFLQPTVIGRSQIPFVTVGSGTMGPDGALSGIPAMTAQYAGAWFVIPANTISASGAGSAAGIYWGVPQSTTEVTLYNYTYTSGPTNGPASITGLGFTTTGVGAFTQLTNQQFTLYKMTLPANMLGLYGTIEIKGNETFTNSAGAKQLVMDYGLTPYGFCLVSVATSGDVDAGFFGGFSNQGATGIQTSLAGYGCQPVASTLANRYGAVDSTAAQPILLRSELSSTSDQMTLESVLVTFIPGL